MRNWLAFGFGALLVGGLLGGCTEAVSSTEMGEDGSVVKVITIREGSASGVLNFGGEEPKPMMDMIKFEGQGWNVKEDTVNGSRVLTAEKRLSSWREADSGWSLVLGDKKSILGRSRIYESEGYLNFEEKYSFVGEVDTAKREKELEEMREKLTANWMKGKLSDKDADELSTKMRSLALRIVFGPSEPILPLLLTSPKRFEREFKIRIFGELSSCFLGINEMDINEAKAQAKKMLAVLDAESQVPNPADGPPPSNDSEEKGNENTYAISVSFKGPVVKEQNGLIDPITDEVYWDFYSMAVEDGPIICRARFRQAIVH
ncbi:MAG: hypothetical protein ACKVQS_07220 [Fimbriimonadaceae bacterium]